MKRRSLLVALLGISACSTVPADGLEGPLASPSPRECDAVVPVARSSRFDFVSKVNGLPYRVMVSTPAKWDRQKVYPVLYVLDGNENFSTATDIMSRHDRLELSAPEHPATASPVPG